MVFMKNITEVTKRDIIDLLVNGKKAVEGEYYLPRYGRLDEISFLKRIYNLSSMPSTDRRFNNAEGDIIQHTCNNDDWPNDWVFYDERFNLFHGEDESFLKFICENFHPAVRVENGPWREFLDDINTLLQQDGYEIYECDKLSGRSVFDFNGISALSKRQPLKSGGIVRGIFDSYTIIRQFDQGGAARLFEVTDSSGEVHAMKVLMSDDKTPSAKIKRFKNELSFLFKHEHDNIVKVTDCGVTADQKGLFYIMPRYSCNLRALINQGLKCESIIKYFWQICEGLKSAHQKSCWHRDLKPENILYDSTTDSVVIADFGIAHFQETDKTTKIKTKETDKLANFDYHAPEQRKGNIVDGPSADIWALGYILNEMFTGELPQGVDFRRISNVSVEYASLDELVYNMLKSRPEERCQSISEVELLFVTRLDEKSIKSYPNLINGIRDALISPQITDIESFINNDLSRQNIIRSIEKAININLEKEICPLYIYYLSRVITHIYSTRSNFNEYNPVIKVLLDVMKDTQLPWRPVFFLTYIAEEFNKIAGYLGVDKKSRNLGEAWEATDTWFSNYKNLPQDNLAAIMSVAKRSSLVSAYQLLQKTLAIA